MGELKIFKDFVEDSIKELNEETNDADLPKEVYKTLKEALPIVKESILEGNQAKLDETVERLSRPSFVRIKEITDTAESRGENQISFMEAKIDDQDKESLKKIIESLNDDFKEKGLYSDIDNWRKVTGLKYRFGKIDIDIFKLLPKGYDRLFFCPECKMTEALVEHKNKAIYILNELNSIFALTTILHEVGHVNCEKPEDKDKAATPNEKNFIKLLFERLPKERNASYFALRKIWKELRKQPETKKDVLTFLKNIAYQSYCLNFFIHVYNMKRISEMLGEFSDESEEDGWLTFKKSAEYAGWKKLSKFADLNDEQEEAAWEKMVNDQKLFMNEEFWKKYYPNAYLKEQQKQQESEKKREQALCEKFEGKPLSDYEKRAWLKFKNSDEYAAWKNIPQHASLAEDNEGRAWLVWISIKGFGEEFEKKYFE
jgi:hypothetical protein